MRVERAPLLALALLLLLTGLWAGLLRLGWAWPPILAPLPLAHGPLMVGGFLGVVIGLERAVGVNQRAAYLVPISAGIGALLTALGVGGIAGPLLITAASIGLVVVMGGIVRLQPTLYTVVLALAAVIWAVGNAVWLLGATIPQVVLAWAAFLILTIAGERLELNRFLRPPRWVSIVFVAPVLLIVIGMLLAVPNFPWGMRVSGAGWLLLALWLLRFDIARRRIATGGQARYMALALLGGFGWLAVGGVLAILHNGAPAGPHYDALLHAVFVGFILSMIFAHVLIIFPAVLQVDLVYHPRFYLPLFLLHASLLLRVVGDLLPWWPARLWGGLLNAVVLLLFLVTVLSAVRRRPKPYNAANYSTVH